LAHRRFDAQKKVVFCFGGTKAAFGLCRKYKRPIIMNVETFKTHELELSSVQSLFNQKQYQEVVALLEQYNSLSSDQLLLFASAYAEQGETHKALDICELGHKQFPGNDEINRLKQLLDRQSHLIEQGLAEVTSGHHSSDNISFLKQHTKQLIEHGRFESGLKQLHQLAEARQAKTTNILWIGNYLKDIYFEPNAASLLPLFDRLLLEEMLFFYLKSCKLFDPGYQKVKEAIKKLD
jgi:tetratricopeptide (TPR) repeat protein